jgi:hypothetical protein
MKREDVMVKIWRRLTKARQTKQMIKTPSRRWTPSLTVDHYSS